MVESTHSIQQRYLACLVESHVHDVALGGSNYHAADPFILLVRTQIGADQLHPSVGEGKIHHPGVGSVGKKEADDLAPFEPQVVVGLAVYQEHVAEATHQRMSRRVPPQRHHSGVGHQDIVQHQHGLLVYPFQGPRVRANQQVPIETQLLLKVLSHVRVIPVDPRVGKAQVIDQLGAGLDRPLSQPRCPIVRIVQPNSVPVNR